MKNKILSALIDIAACIGIVIGMFGLSQYLAAPGTGQQPFVWNPGFVYVAMIGLWAAVLGGVLNYITPISITYDDIYGGNKSTP